MVGFELFYTNFKYQRNHLFIQVWTNSQVLKETSFLQLCFPAVNLKSSLAYWKFS